MASFVGSVRIPELVSRLREGEYLIPKFQREFVWSTSDVIALLSSVIDARPIGMLTVWEQDDNAGLDLEHISLPDNNDDDAGIVYFGKKEDRTKKFYAVLDGRQRSTAIAMAFGGLSANDARRKHSGRFFLNVAAEEPIDWIVFKKWSDIEKEKLKTLSNCISQGLFPFEIDLDNFEDIDKQWMFYIKCVSNKDYYNSGKLPDASELDRREKVISNAFSGIIDTTFAVYTVPKKYDLGTICEIFETLNTTGTRVSTVDLIHSWLYADTRDDVPAPLMLRDWIRELGQKDGALGWADPDDRPELIAQFVTAAYIAEKSPSEPRKIGGKFSNVTSVKSGDLLATPSSHWKNVAGRRDEFASYLGDFQRTIAGGKFSMRHCPYPISAGIYIALRWTNSIDERSWGIDEINSLYRAFFWRNALLGRYDQGFLTKMSTDLKMLMELLSKRGDFILFAEWATECNLVLSREVGARPEEQNIRDGLLDPKPAGALAKALTLPLLTKPIRDLLDPMGSIEFGKANEFVELHHIYPRAWIRDNIKQVVLDKWIEDSAGGTNCIANMAPMLRTSNNSWKAKVPGNALHDAKVTFDTHANVLESHFFDQEMYDILVSHNEDLPSFWARRAQKVATELYRKTLVVG